MRQEMKFVKIVASSSSAAVVVLETQQQFLYMNNQLFANGASDSGQQ